MWRLWHKLFGWDYISFEYGYDNKIRRIKQAPNHVRYVSAYGDMFYLDENYTLYEMRHGSSRKYIPLTFVKELHRPTVAPLKPIKQKDNVVQLKGK